MLEKNYISENAVIKADVTLESPVTLYGTARINSGSAIGRFSYVESRTTIFPKTTIGRYSSIGKGCQIGVIAHPVDWLSTSPIQYNIAYHFPDYAEGFPQRKFERPMETIIGNDVWIGSMVLIKRGLNIGDGAIIAGGAVVVKDVPPYAIVGGVPAKIIRYRFDPHTIQKLLSFKWWDLPHTSLIDIEFDNIKKALLTLENLKKNNVQDKPQKCWVCKRGEKEKLIQKEKLAKYIKDGWTKGKKFNHEKKQPMIKKKIQKVSSKKSSQKELQNILNQQMEDFESSSRPVISIEKLYKIISTQLLEIDISEDVIEDILSQNKNMNRDYNEDEYEDNMILNHKIAAVGEIVLADKGYIEEKQLSPKAHKKISNVLRSKQ